MSSDKRELQKQLGCMNGIFQLFDRRYLLGQRCHGHNQKRLPPGQSDKGEKELKNASEQAKEKAPKVVMKEKNRVSVELSRNSFSSSSSSTAMSSSQTVFSEPVSSPSLHRKQQDLFMPSPDIRDVVKDSMTREPRVVSIKTVAKDERVGPAMKHVDSPRPFPNQKPVQYDGNDRNFPTRFSCDGRESQSRYLLKSNMKVKELPRLSLDSKQSRISNSTSDSRRNILIKESQNEPISNKRPSSSSSVVARLMGLEALTVSIDESETLKTKPEELVSESRRKEENLKHDRTSVSPRRVSHIITRIPLETAPWKQEGSGRGSQKPPFKSKEGQARAKPASRSIYGEIEKRLTEHEFKTSGKDLRALKQILEAMQNTKRRLENDNSIDDDSQSQKSYQQVPPKKHEFLNVKTKPAKLTSDSMMITSLQKVKQADAKKDSHAGRQRLKDPSLRDRKATGAVSPRMQRSKNGIEKPSSVSGRAKKQPSMQRTRLDSPTGNSKAKFMDPLQESMQLSQHSDAVSFQSESYSLASQNDSEITSEWNQEVNSPFRPQENHRSNIAERLTEDKLIVDHAKHTMEQPSPVSVLDAFYTEDTPSPVKKKSNAFNDDDNLHYEETKDQYSEFNNMKLENIKNLVHQIKLLNTNADDDATVNHTVTSPCEGETGEHKYVAEILLASGFLNDQNHTTTIVQLHPTGTLINPELFDVLEKTKTNMRSNYSEKIRRKLVFDTVNDVLGHKLAMLGPFGPNKHKGRILNGNKLLTELCSEIANLQNNSDRSIYDENDDVLNIINADINNRSQIWGDYCYQVPGVVLDIERLIFKDLVSEVVNAPHVTGLQNWSVGHRRQLFPM